MFQSFRSLPAVAITRRRAQSVIGRIKSESPRPFALGWTAAIVGQGLNFGDRQIETIVLGVPYRVDNGRDRLLEMFGERCPCRHDTGQLRRFSPQKRQAFRQAFVAVVTNLFCETGWRFGGPVSETLGGVSAQRGQ